MGSYLTLTRCLAKFDKVVAVFCDTLAEDGDTYRFIDDVEAKTGVELVRLCVGKTPLELCFEHNFIFNSRVAICNKVLKTKPFNEWLKLNYPDPETAVIAMGIDWMETRRCPAITRGYAPYEVIFPLCDKPWLTKEQMLERLKSDGIEPPRMYGLGYSHSNCGGCCVKAGIGHYRNMLRVDPIRFREVENKEQRLRDRIGKDVSILKRKGKPYTLRQLRLEEGEHKQTSVFDFTKGD